MGEAKRRKLAGETEEQKVKREQKWEGEKRFGNYMKKSHRFIRGRFDPETKEITEY